MTLVGVSLRCWMGQYRHGLLRSRSGRSHVTLPVPTQLLQTDKSSFLGALRYCLLGPMSLSFSCHCIRCTNHRREHSQENESHTLIVLFPRKECMSVLMSWCIDVLMCWCNDWLIVWLKKDKTWILSWISPNKCFEKEKICLMFYRKKEGNLHGTAAKTAVTARCATYSRFSPVMWSKIKS